MAYKLCGMVLQRWIGVVTIAVFTLTGCRGERKTQPLDTTALHVTDTVTAEQSDTVSTWNSAAGPFLAIETDTGSTAVNIVGGSDSNVVNPVPLPFDLFGRSGLMGTSTLAPGIAAEVDSDCVEWPVGHLKMSRGGWGVGLESGLAVPIPLDSLEAMRSTDSSQFVTEVVRIASGLRVTQDPTFSSIPFVVQRAYRFRTESIEGISALVQRSIQTEADPRADYTMFVAERPIGSTEPYNIAYQKRSAGREDETVVVSVLAAVRLVKTHHAMLIVRYELAEGAMIGLIERMRPGVWRATWTSDYSGC